MFRRLSSLNEIHLSWSINNFFFSHFFVQTRSLVYTEAYRCNKPFSFRSFLFCSFILSFGRMNGEMVWSKASITNGRCPTTNFLSFIRCFSFADDWVAGRRLLDDNIEFDVGTAAVVVVVCGRACFIFKAFVEAMKWKANYVFVTFFRFFSPCATQRQRKTNLKRVEIRTKFNEVNCSDIRVSFRFILRWLLSYLYSVATILLIHFRRFVASMTLRLNAIETKANNERQRQWHYFVTRFARVQWAWHCASIFVSLKQFK